MNQGQSLDEYIESNRKGGVRRQRGRERRSFEDRKRGTLRRGSDSRQKNYISVKRYDNRQEIRRRSDRFRGRSRYQMIQHQSKVVPTLQVNGFGQDIQNNQLNELFSSVGQLTKCRIDYDNLGNSKKVAYVKYRNIADTNKAIQKFNEAELDGHQLTIRKKFSKKVGQEKSVVPGVKRRTYFKTKNYNRSYTRDYDRSNRIRRGTRW